MAKTALIVAVVSLAVLLGQAAAQTNVGVSAPFTNVNVNKDGANNGNSNVNVVAPFTNDNVQKGGANNGESNVVRVRAPFVDIGVIAPRHDGNNNSGRKHLRQSSTDTNFGSPSVGFNNNVLAPSANVVNQANPGIVYNNAGAPSVNFNNMVPPSTVTTTSTTQAGPGTVTSFPG